MNFLYTAQPTGDLEIEPHQLHLSEAEMTLLQDLLEGLRYQQLARLDLTLGNGQIIFLTGIDVNKGQP